MKKLTTAVRNLVSEDDVIAIFFVTSTGTKVSAKFSEIQSQL